MMVSRKNFSRNAFNNRSDHLTDIENAPDLPSLAIEKLSLRQRLKRAKKEMEDAPEVLSLAIEYMSLHQQLKRVKREIKKFSKEK
jgi:hypothetical protein